MNNISKKIDVNSYIKEIDKKNDIDVIEPVRIVNMATGEVFSSNEVNAFSDFENLTKKYGSSCSLFFPAGNTGR